jgi:glycosyltransferase involved in cell wall biosynthesis
MLISIVIPAYRATETLADAVRSVLAQTMSEWECIVVSDDGIDYKAALDSLGLSDHRLSHVSTGRNGSGCHAARNRGLTECRGDVVCALDADDVWMARRLEVLTPQAISHGAAVDGPRVIDGSEVLYSALDSFSMPFMLDASQLLGLTCPLFPVTRRELTFARTPGVEHLEDVVANLVLISSNGPIWATPEPLMDYRVSNGSMCHGDDSAVQFDRAYADILERLASGKLAVGPQLRANAITGLEQKRALNKRFGDAQRHRGDLNFQAFVAAQRRLPRA